MSFEEHIQSISSETAFWMMALRVDDHPIDKLGRVGLEVSDGLRAIGIMLLLSRGDAEGFHLNLLRSGWARRRFLERALEEGATEDHHFVAGRCGPVLDAIAARGDDLVAGIHAAVPDAWRSGHEYEDEHCFARLLAVLAAGAEADQTDLIEDLLERMEAALPPEGGARASLCRALIDREEQAFGDAFAERLAERQAEIDADKQRGQLESPGVIAERRIFVEGLALLRLADDRGLATDAEYPFCPSNARCRTALPFDGP